MTIIEKSKTYVESLFKDANNKKLSYHNFNHTMTVFNAVDLIVDNTPGISVIEKEHLLIAALFHDSAYPDSSIDHELKSSEIASDYLSSNAYDVKGIESVKELILATKLGHTPTNLLEEIILDADLSHLGSKNYMGTTFKFLQKEVKDLKNSKLSREEWSESCRDFFENHKYYTAFARKEFVKMKEQNLVKIKKLIQKYNSDKVKKKKPLKPEKNGKAEGPIKGVETMFRVALRNHLSLSQIADNKANTLISVNAIIISIVLSALFPKLDSNPYLFYPGVSILLFTIVTIILSILSTIPNVNRGIITRNEVLEKKGNLLFFGNFFKMDLVDFEWGMKELMQDKDYLYNSLSRDLYFLGKVLNKKYKLLRLAYYSFVIGLVGSIIIFVVSISSIIHSW